MVVGGGLGYYLAPSPYSRLSSTCILHVSSSPHTPIYPHFGQFAYGLFSFSSSSQFSSSSAPTSLLSLLLFLLSPFFTSPHLTPRRALLPPVAARGTFSTREISIISEQRPPVCHYAGVGCDWGWGAASHITSGGDVPCQSSPPSLPPPPSHPSST